MNTEDRARKGIFISYRRDDSAGEAGRLSDHLAAAFGGDLVFLDVATIVAGDDWRGRIDVALDNCDTMLVVVGRQWLTRHSSTHPAVRRIDEHNDMVAWEVARGLSRGLRVVQVLVQDTSPLVAEELPPNIAALAMRQSIAIRHETFAANVRELVNQIKRSRRARSIFRADWVASDLSRWARVRDSGADYTAAAITIVNALELLLARAGTPRQLSVRYLYEKARRHQHLPEDAGGLYLQPALFVASFFGVPEEDVWPYRPGNSSLPKEQTWETLEKKLGPCYRGDFFRVDGLMDAIRQLAAGRPIVATFEIKGNAWFESPVKETGQIPMPPQTSSTFGLSTGLLTRFDPRARQFRFLGTWGANWGDEGFGTMSLDVARRIVHPEDLWSVELSRFTADHLLEVKLRDARRRPRRARSNP